MNRRGTDELAQAIQARHACSAKFKREEIVEAKLRESADWDGKVCVYSVDHPEADTCYAWSMPFDGSKLPWSTDASGPRAIFAILHHSSVDCAAAAVRAAHDALEAIGNGQGDLTIVPVHGK